MCKLYAFKAFRGVIEIFEHLPIRCGHHFSEVASTSLSYTVVIYCFGYDLGVLEDSYEAFLVVAVPVRHYDGVEDFAMFRQVILPLKKTVRGLVGAPIY